MVEGQEVLPMTSQNDMPSPYPFYAAGSVPNLQGTLGGTDQIGTFEAQALAQLQALMEMARNQPAPQEQQVPQTPSLPIAGLSLLLGSLGGALAKQPGYAMAPVQAIAGRVQERKQVQRENIEKKQAAELHKQETLMTLALKRVQLMFDMAKREDNQEAAQQLAQLKSELTANRDEVNSLRRLLEIEARGKQEILKKKTAGAPTRHITERTTTVTGIPGAAPSRQSKSWPTQVTAAYRQDLKDAERQVKEKLVKEKNAKKRTTLVSEYNSYKQDLFKFYQDKADSLTRK